MKFAKEFAEDGLVVLGVVRPEQNDADWSRTNAVIEEYHLEFPTLVDEGGEVAQAYNVRGIPRTFVIGADGVVKADILGAQPEAVFRAGLKEAGLE